MHLEKGIHRQQFAGAVVSRRFGSWLSQPVGTEPVHSVEKCPGKPRAGKASGVLSLGLFLLSLLLVFPALKWAYQSPAGGPAHVEYVFSPDPAAAGSQRPPTVEPAALKIKSWHYVPDLEVELAQFETVFWEPSDTDSLRSWIHRSSEVAGSQVLEIGTGTGLVAVACLLQGAGHVVATDINPQAYANARYNADHLQLTDRIDVRLASPDAPGPFEVVHGDERFDLIVSNPPWENAPVSEPAAHALYDPEFALLDGLLSNSQKHLRAGGRLLLAYGAKKAIERILRSGPPKGWRVEICDDRELAELPEVFVPGMLLVLTRAQQ